MLRRRRFAKLIEKDRKIVDGSEFKSEISIEAPKQPQFRARDFKVNYPVSLTEDELTTEGEAFRAEEESTHSELLPAEKDEAISASMTELDAAFTAEKKEDFPAKRRPR